VDVGALTILGSGDLGARVLCWQRRRRARRFSCRPFILLTTRGQAFEPGVETFSRDEADASGGSLFSNARTAYFASSYPLVNDRPAAPGIFDGIVNAEPAEGLRSVSRWRLGLHGHGHTKAHVPEQSDRCTYSSFRIRAAGASRPRGCVAEFRDAPVEEALHPVDLFVRDGQCSFCGFVGSDLFSF
jgi:hypothetical protein